MERVKFFKVKVLPPGRLEPNSFYFVYTNGIVKSYLTTNQGTPQPLNSEVPSDVPIILGNSFKYIQVVTVEEKEAIDADPPDTYHDTAFLVVGVGVVIPDPVVTPVNADYSVGNITEEGAEDGVITFSNPSGGSGDYEFSIDNTNWTTNTIFSSLAPGTYQLWVRDTNNHSNNSNLATIEIEEPEEVIPDPDWYDLFSILWLADNGGVEGNELVCVRGSNISILSNDLTEDYIHISSSASFDINSHIFTPSELIEDDYYPGMPILYDNESPHHIRGIGVLKSEIIDILDNPTHEDRESILKTLHEKLDLYLYWSGEWNDFGVMKANRTIEGSVSADFTFTEITETDADDGIITIINSEGGGGQYEYSIDDGVSWYPSNEFTNLAPDTYIIKIRDSQNISNEALVGTIEFVNPVPVPVHSNYSVTYLSEEGQSDGVIQFLSPSGGSGQYEYSIDNGITWQQSSLFENLSQGEYNLRIRDAENIENDVFLNSVFMSHAVTELYDGLMLQDGMILMDN